MFLLYEFCMKTCQHVSRSLKIMSKRWIQHKAVEIGVVSNGGYGTSKTIVVSLDNQSQRLLFNCGEGTIRTFNAYRSSVPYLRKTYRINDIFITQLSVRNVSGIQEFTRSTKRYSALRLYGIGDLRNLSVLGFKNRNDSILDSIDVTEEGQYYESRYIQIKCVPLIPVLSDTPTSQHLIPGDRLPVDITSDQNRQLSAIVYILKPKLQDAPAVIILDCPDKRYLESLLKSKDLKKHQKENRTVVFHLSPLSVVQDTGYQTFINRFPESTKHLHVDENRTAKALDFIRNHCISLNKIDSSIFPLPTHDEFDESDVEISRKSTELNSRLTTVNNGHVEIYCKKDQRYLSESNYTNKADSLEEFIRKKNVYLTEIKKRLQRRARKEAEYPDILFLGTAGRDHVRRNNSGVYIQLCPETAILLDCGSGIYTQLCLHFGSRTNEMLRKIKCIFISHLHLDHYSGLATLLKHRCDGFDGPAQQVTIISHQKILEYLQIMNWEMNSVLNSVKFHSLEKWKYEEVKHLCKELNLYELRPVEALHGIPAKSVSLRHSSGVHLVYSGDTMPNEQLIKRGFDCDILIHEATFQQKDIAQKSYHSTVEDAIDVSERMKAKHTILTNFVNEDLSQQTRELLLSKSNVTVAVDFMRVRMSDLPYTPLLNPFLIHR